MKILGHNFSFLNEAIYESFDIKHYFCETCNIKIVSYSSHFNHKELFALDHTGLYKNAKKLTISCDEYIIKNILE